MCGVYKITNLVNDKCYIGQSVNIEERWARHKNCAFNSNRKEYEYPLYRAIRKYGIENFSFDVIKECDKEKLDGFEKYYIKYFKSHLYEKGYNLTSGGGGGRLGYHIFQFDFSGNFISEYTSIRSASERTGIDHASISRALIGKKQSAGNFLWTFSKDVNIRSMVEKLSNLNYSNGTKDDWIIDVYDLNGNFIDTFNNSAEASEYFNIPRGSISKCIRGIIYTSHNLQFVKHGEQPSKSCKKSHAARPTLQYSMDGNLIARYNSATEIKKILGFDNSSISKCCNGKVESAYGYIWRYEE